MIHNPFFNIVFTIINFICEFDTILTTWYKLPLAENTWHNFKQHFTKAYNNILQVKGKTIINTPYLQTNKAISQLMEEFAQMRNEVLNSVNPLAQVNSNMYESHEPSTSGPSLTSMNVSSLTQTQTIDSTIQDDTKDLK